jgi:hypothetical protein
VSQRKVRRSGERGKGGFARAPPIRREVSGQVAPPDHWIVIGADIVIDGGISA